MQQEYVDQRMASDFELDDETRDQIMKAAMDGEDVSDMEIIESDDQRARGCSDEMMANLALGPISDDDRYITLIDNIEDGRYHVRQVGVPHAANKVSQRVARIDLVQLAYMHMQGATTKAMADFFQVTQPAIAKARVSPAFKSVQAMISGATVQTARVFMAGATIKATKTLLSLLDSDSDKIKLAAACQVLDRVGLKSPDQIEVLQNATGMHTMSEKELMLIVQTAMKELPKPEALHE